MLDIAVTGTTDPALIDNIAYAFEFYTNTLLGVDDDRDLDVLIDVSPIHPTDPMRVGSCIPVTFDDYPKQFELFIKGDSDMYLTLAHECVHVKQYYKGEMALLPGTPKLSWGAQVLDIPQMGDPLYWDSPWEIEAFGRQYGLYNRLLTHINSL